MREVNFSIPAANKASVGITTALYDRRALDCTSTLPLINSLNHLAYLTTSSARIREILTVDGGIERLVCILKDGRSRDANDSWKWSLALQCVVNIGVRGSESVRTRVVEADVVPVIATILDNYMQVSEKLRVKEERTKEESSDGKQEPSRHKRVFRPDETTVNVLISRTETRRPVPAAIHIPRDGQPQNSNGSNATPPSNARGIPARTQPMVLSSPAEQPAHSHQRSRHRRHRQSHGDAGSSSVDSRPRSHTAPSEPPPTITGATRASEAPEDETMLSENQGDLLSRPESPQTPTATYHPDSSATQMEESPEQLRRHPSIRQEVSIAGDSDDGQIDGLPGIQDVDDEVRPEPIVGIQNGMDDQEVVDRAALIDAVESQDRMATPSVPDNADGDFAMTDRSMDGAITTNAVPGAPNITAGLPTPLNVSDAITQPTPTPWNHRFPQDRLLAGGPLSALPRDDCIWALQLLAYVSKYCNLRTYFQQSHLVPKLKIGREVQLVDGEIFIDPLENATNEEEYLQPDDYNIFPLVEKFTVRHHCDEMKYWAGVVMRNLCRKDRSRKGIRQCAYYKCGKWEDYPRQFAKCRRCRQTKYCSKECQKSAWVYHRHWCQTASV